MADLLTFFASIENDKPGYVGVPSGEEFEQRIMNGLHQSGFNRILERDIGAHALVIKPQVRDHFHEENIPNPTNYRAHYWYQPSGSQNYPDFVIFWGQRLLCLEAKFSKEGQKKPVWNSGLPRQNGIYIFGSRRVRDVTFFMGRDVITEETARQMHDLFSYLQGRQIEFNENLGPQPYGFSVYVRKAFDQSKKMNPDAVLDFFSNPNRQNLENSVKQFVEQTQ